MNKELSEHLLAAASEETPPKAGAMINTFRAFGYNLQTAVADIIDNSISAKAQNIWINFEWKGEDSWVTITDDGLGMDKEELVIAMTPGSKDPQDERDENDLGRFGMGLKTSSFSQCKALTVITKKENYQLIKRCWDLDYVNQTGKWNLLDYLSNNFFLEILQGLGHGTTVVWEKMDRLVGKSTFHNEAARKVFLQEFENVEEHLSLVFHRFMEKKRLSIWMNGNKIEPWDPYMKDFKGNQLIARESLDNDQVKVKCYVIPHISQIPNPKDRQAAKSEKWYNLQGFYIYRKERLLLYGDWLGLFPKNEHYKNARILIDIPNRLDHEWKIDIKKASATPSITVRRDLIRLGKLTRKAAAEIYKYRGNEIMLNDNIKSFSFQPVWKARKSRDDIRNYFINQEHTLVKDLINKESVTQTELKAILKLIGSTIPVESIIQYHSEEPESHELRENQKEPDTGTIALAQVIYKSLSNQGVTKEMATKQIFNIEPFNQYPQLIEFFD